MYQGENIGIIKDQYITGSGHLFDLIIQEIDQMLVSKSYLDTCLIIFHKKDIDKLLNDDSLGSEEERKNIIDLSRPLRSDENKIYLPDSFIEYAHLKDNIRLIGMFDTFELFSEEIYLADQF